MAPLRSTPADENCSRALRVWSAGLVAITAAALVTAAALYRVPGPAEAGNGGASSGRIVAVGDAVCAPSAPVTASECHSRAVADVVKRLKPRRVLLLGDLQYDVGAPSAYRGAFDPLYGSLRRELRPAPGNHDYATARAAGYFGYFGRRVGSPDRGYYSFDFAGWHIVSLNSNCSIVGCDEASAQARWLRRDLARNAKRCTMAYWHHPLASSGKHGMNLATAGLWKELQRARADLILTGHDHGYERFAPLGADAQPSRRNGIRQMVVGTGGRSIYPIANRMPGSIKRVGAFGAAALDLRPAGYSWRFVDEAGTVRDSGRLRCR